MQAAPRSFMPSGLLTADSLPLYGQVAMRLWEDIQADHPKTGDRLPSERILSARYSVSRVTLRTALGELESRNLVKSSPARGWFVDDVGPQPQDVNLHSVQGFAAYAAEHGLTARNVVLRSRVRSCSLPEAESLRIAPGAAVFELRRLRYLNDQVVAWEENRVPLHLCPALPTTDFSAESLYATLRDAEPSQVPQVAIYSVEAGQPTAEQKSLLEMDDPTPILVATTIAYNHDGSPLELGVAVYRGDRYRFRAQITN